MRPTRRKKFIINVFLKVRPFSKIPNLFQVGFEKKKIRPFFWPLGTLSEVETLQAKAKVIEIKTQMTKINNNIMIHNSHEDTARKKIQ